MAVQRKDAVVTDPDCVNGGYTTHTCTVCGDSYTDSETDSLGHTWVDATYETPKTCSTCGETEGEAEEETFEDECESLEISEDGSENEGVESGKESDSKFGIGCGGSIGVGAIAIVAVIGVAVFAAKKKNNE